MKPMPRGGAAPDSMECRDLLDVLPSSEEVRAWLALSNREAGILRRLLEVIEAAERDLKPGDVYVPSPKTLSADEQAVLRERICDLGLSVRSRNCLEKAGVVDLGDLCQYTEEELLANRNFGDSSLAEIRKLLVSRGLLLGQFAAERLKAKEG